MRLLPVGAIMIPIVDKTKHVPPLSPGCCFVVAIGAGLQMVEKWMIND